MRRRRGLEAASDLCSGPGKLCQALAVTLAHDTLSLSLPPFAITPARGEAQVAVGTRVGITKAAERPWRFGMAGSRYLSRRL
jgi:DNA-3-methyladenine glycosylase